MLEKCTGLPLRAWTQLPSHWLEWLHTSEHTALMGLFSKSSAPASSILRSLKSRMTSGMGVWTGQPRSWHIARRQPRQRLASSMTWTATTSP